MEISQLKAFRALAKTTNYVEASKVLGKSISTVGRHIRQLEENLGVALFEKENGRYELSEHGRALLPHVDGVFEEFENLDKAFNERKRQSEKEIKIGTSLRSISKPFLEFRKIFLAEFTEAEMFLKRFQDDARAMAALLQGKLDVVVCPKQNDLDNRFRGVTVGRCEIVPFASSNHPIWSNNRKIKEGLVDNDTFVILEGDGFIQNKTLDAISEHKLRPRYKYFANDSTILKGLVNSCSGIGFLPAWSIVDELETGEYIALELPNQVSFELQYVISSGDARQIVQDFMRMRTKNPPRGVERIRSAHK